jgi:endo-1,4-beta-xylanase
MTHALSRPDTRAGTALLLALALFALPVAGRAQVVQHDFEDGTTQGWFPRGTAVLTVTNEAAASGVNSLKTTGRTASWNGPTLNVMPVLQKDLLYQIRVSVRLTAAQATLQDTLRMTIQRRVAGETSDRYDAVAASATNGVTSGSWVTLQGSYRLTTEVTKLNLYLETVGATTEFYIDDFRILEVVPDQTGIACNFETDRNSGLFCFTTPDGSDRSWTRLGTAVLTNVTEEAHGGTHSLRTTGRTLAWQGPALNITGKMSRGFRYRVTVWAKLAAGELDANLRVTVERRLAGVSTFHTVVPNTLVTAAEWIRMSALFTMPGDADYLSLKVETATAATTSFSIDDFALSYAPPPPIQTDIPSLKDVLADSFTIGAAVDVGEIASARHTELTRKHYDTITARYSWKFGQLHPSESTYSFGAADTVANFARQNGLKVRGHTLVWHKENPAWLFQDASGVDLTPTPENKELVLQRLESHIRTVVPRYADVVSSWDVVNEVVDPSQPDGLRRSRWLELTGTDYIDRAFQVAREVAGPAVKLCINDYSTTDPAKRQALLDLVQGMLARGVPVDCVGHQMHINIGGPSVAAIRTSVEAFAALGLDNQITEMDMSVYTDGTSRYQVVPREILVKQAYRYRDIFREYRRLSRSISSVTFWGLADDNTWLSTFPIARLDLPLLFDDDLQAKLAYWGVVDPLQLPVLTQRLPVTKNTSEIDHHGEERWDGDQDERRADHREIDWATAASTTFGDEDTVPVTFKALWDEQHLYLLVSVSDATRSRDDRVEVFIDENNDKATSYQPDDAAYAFGRFRAGRHGVRFRMRERLGGYELEATLPIARALTTGAEIGFDIRVIDANRGAVAAWNDFTINQTTDTSKFGTLSLVGENQVAEVHRGTPLVDGVEDPVWAGVPEIATNTWVLGTAGATARVKTLWDAGHLYVFAHVADPLLSKASANAWEQDSIEVFLDQDNGKTSEYQPDDGQFRVNYENTQTFGGSANAGRMVSATKVVPGGYDVELAITFDAIEPRVGTVIGVDFQVNDDGPGNGHRSSIVTWNDPTGESYRNTSRFGVLRLVPERQQGCSEGHRDGPVEAGRDNYR